MCAHGMCAATDGMNVLKLWHKECPESAEMWSSWVRRRTVGVWWGCSVTERWWPRSSTLVQMSVHNKHTHRQGESDTGKQLRWSKKV